MATQRRLRHRKPVIVSELLAIALYAGIILTIGLLATKRDMSSSDFNIGGRSMNFYVTALSAHASDMSSWLIMAYPGMVYATGIFHMWAAFGLFTFMFLNWQFVAPRIRSMTERYNALTFSSFFESRFQDTSGLIRIFTAVMSLIFFSIYVSAGLIGLGIIVNSLFGFDYTISITVGILVIMPYLLLGGYRAIAWIDLFQGLFLLLVIVFVPFAVFFNLFDQGVVIDTSLWSMELNPFSTTGHPLLAFTLFAGWGLGYFGQPHIVTKFMGIDDVQEMNKAKYVGMSWLALTLLAATFVGLIGQQYFTTPLVNDELVFIKMVHEMFSPFFSSFILCAGLAAIISTMDSQILVLATSLTEDFYRKVFRKGAGSKELLWATRGFVVIVAVIAYAIAIMKPATINKLVLYAWSGLGSSFGPLVLFSLYSERTTKYGAWAGILIGGITSALWGIFEPTIPPLIPGFVLSSLALWIFRYQQPALEKHP